MKKTGELLKKEREKQGVSLNEISMATKISVRMLKAVEDGNIKDLPAKTFLRGFVKSYASQLKMDVDGALKTFHQEMGSTLVQTDIPDLEDQVHTDPQSSSPTPSHLDTEPRTKSEGSVSVSRAYDLVKAYGLVSKLMYAGVLAALVLLIYGVRNIVIKYERESQVEAPVDIKGIDSKEPKKSQVSKVKKENGEAEEIRAKLPNTVEKEKTVSKIQSQKTPKPEEDKVEAKTQEASNKKEDETQPVKASQIKKIEDQEPKASLLEKKPTPSQESSPKIESLEETKPSSKTATNKFVDKNEIIIEAFDSVKLEFRIGKGDLQKVSLGPDEIHTIKANAQVRIDFSDGGAVNITHNGRDRGVPGDLGKPKKVILP